MRALITGIDGFVGYHLYKLLIQQGVEVHGTTILESYTNEEVVLYKMNLLDSKNVEEVIQKVQPDYVYHLAGQSAVGLSWQQPVMTMSVNVNGTINLLEAIRKQDKHCRTLIIGSSDQYGPVTPEMCPIQETSPLNPVSPYGISKCTQEQMAQLYVKAYAMDIIMVRAFNHIGPMQGINFVVSDFASKIVEIERGEKPIIKVGNLEAFRDFTDVRDIVQGYYVLMQKGHTGEVYNIGSNKAIQIQEILKKMINLSTHKIEVVIDKTKFRPIDVSLVQCDNGKIKNHTQWEIKRDIDESLKDILEYWRKN